MGALASALSTLAAKTVTGVNDLVAHDAIGVIADTDLPIMFPWFTPDFGLQPSDFRGAPFVDSGEYSFRFAHICLVEAVGVGKLATKQSTVITLIENYVAAIAADVDMGGNLAKSLKFEIRIGQQNFRFKPYYGFVALHEWVIQL